MCHWELDFRHLVVFCRSRGWPIGKPWRHLGHYRQVPRHKLLQGKLVRQPDLTLYLVLQEEVAKKKGKQYETFHRIQQPEGGVPQENQQESQTDYLEGVVPEL